jgi:hypothetical protein
LPPYLKIKTMKHTNIAVALGALGFSICSLGVLAQEKPAATEPAGDYSLKASSVGAADTGTQPLAAPTYGMAGTGFTTVHATDGILTARIPERAAPIKTDGGVFFYPSVFVGIGHNDNVLGTPTNQIKSAFLNVSPEVVAELKNRGDRYTAKATIDALQYDSSHDDDFVAHDVRVAGDNYFSQRARMGWSIGHIGAVDPRGWTQRTESTNPDKWTASVLEGRFIYGAPEAAGRVELDVNYVPKRYQNNRTFTEVADVNVTEIAGRVFYRIGSRTLAFVEARQTQYDYTSSAAIDSNTERNYNLGVTWEATAATTGVVKVGHLSKNFDLAGLSDFSGTSWEASVRWLPLSYSAFDLTASRSTADPTGLGDYLLNTGASLAWVHRWTGYVNTRVSYGSLRTSFAAASRLDTAKTWNAMVSYNVLRWLTLGVDYAHIDRSSTDPTAAFRRNVVMLTANVTL